MDNQEKMESQETKDDIKNQMAMKKPVEWESPEYYPGEKNKIWYLLFSIMVIVGVVVSLWLFKSYSFAVLLVIMAIAIVVYSQSKPENIKYTLSVKQGLYIGDKLYNLQDFKSFSINQDDERYSVTLIPIKRFSPALSIFFPKNVGEKIVDILAIRLPMEEHEPDFMDKIIKILKI